jgi:hypothetical protein
MTATPSHDRHYRRAIVDAIRVLSSDDPGPVTTNTLAGKLRRWLNCWRTSLAPGAAPSRGMIYSAAPVRLVVDIGHPRPYLVEYVGTPAGAHAGTAAHMRVRCADLAELLALPARLRRHCHPWTPASIACVAYDQVRSEYGLGTVARRDDPEAAPLPEEQWDDDPA